MQIIAQSQTPTKVSYIHLAYLAAALNSRISLVPGEAYLGVALATAVACGVLAAKRAGATARVRAIKYGAVMGFIGGLGLMWLLETGWQDLFGSALAVRRVVQTRQWWAMRDPRIAAGVESAASTNGEAAGLAAYYYEMTGATRRDAEPELKVKYDRFCEIAVVKGASWWHLYTNSLDSYDEEKFRAALKRGKLGPAEVAWVKEKLVPFDKAGKSPAAK
jgi:hypothetical protein